MSATASRSPVPEVPAGSGSSLSVLRTKQMIALLRICALAVVMVVSSARRASGRMQVGGAAILILGLVYALACLFLSRRGEASSPWSRTATVAIDVALIAAWIQATGGAGASSGPCT